MKIAAKPYKTRGMVEVDQTRTNFDAIFHCVSIAWITMGGPRLLPSR